MAPAPARRVAPGAAEQGTKARVTSDLQPHDAPAHAAEQRRRPESGEGGMRPGRHDDPQSRPGRPSRTVTDRGRYLVHGLVVEVDIVLDLPAAQDEPADLTLFAAEPRPVPAEAPAGRLVASNEIGGRPRSFLVRNGNTFVLRMPDLFEAVIDLTSGVGSYARDEQAPDGMVAVLVPGALLAAYLLIRGELALHASAVHLNELGGAVAFVGSSGRGKSTLATLLCAAGGRLLTDDVLRVDLTPNGATGRRGASGTRLRPMAWPLLEQHVIPAVSSVDGRRLAAVAIHDTEAVLRCVVLPTPDRDIPVVRLQRLTPVEAIMTLTRHPRILGWADPEIVKRQFDLTVELVRRVPMFEARVPWGPPFPPDLASALRGCLLDRAGEASPAATRRAPSSGRLDEAG